MFIEIKGKCGLVYIAGLVSGSTMMINRSCVLDDIDNKQVLCVGVNQSSLMFGSQWLIKRFFWIRVH